MNDTKAMTSTTKTMARRKGEAAFPFSERAAAAFGACAFEYRTTEWLGTKKTVSTTRLCATCAPGFGHEEALRARPLLRGVCARCGAKVTSETTEAK